MLLHENIYTIPNMLTVGRLIAAPYVGYLIVNHEYPLALGVFVLAGLTDMVCNSPRYFFSVQLMYF